MADTWQTKSLSVVNLHLDPKNPRLGRETSSRAPREIIQYLFDHDSAVDVAESIATRGFFPNEPLLAIKEMGHHVVVEGNRRLAALKALREPGLLDGSMERKVEKLARRIPDISEIAKVPVNIAPNRRETDRQIAGRHIGTPVLAWQAENRASFILDKLAEGYNNLSLNSELGFSLADIQKARQTRAVADMARSLDLPAEVKAKLDNPRAKFFTTIERVFDSSVGRKYLMIEPDTEHGIRGTTTKSQFIRGYKKLVQDVVLGKESSRTLNASENIERYFRGWSSEELPSKKHGSFTPSDVIEGKSVASSRSKPDSTGTTKKSKQGLKTVLPRDLKVLFGDDRMIDIRRELIKLKREEFPNAGAVLLRVFLELSIIHYLERTGELPKIKEELRKKGKLRYGTPVMRDLARSITGIAKKKLNRAEGLKVEKALRHDPAAPFTLSDLHAFVHQSDLPGERDIHQFWLRTEPLFRLMLETEGADS